MHRRVLRRKTVRIGVLRDVGDSKGHAVANDRPEQPVALRQRPDARAQLGGHAARDEALDVATLVDDAQGGVLGAHELADVVDDDLEHAVEVELAGDGARRAIEGIERVIRTHGERLSRGRVRQIARHPPRLPLPRRMARGERAEGHCDDTRLPTTIPAMPDPNASPVDSTPPSELSRRGFLRGAVLAGGGALAATVAAACAPAATPG